MFAAGAPAHHAGLNQHGRSLISELLEAPPFELDL